MQEGTAPTTDEKVWAAIAHASAVLSFWGPIVPAVIWFTNRKRSTYARFHALQAMTYQVLGVWIYVGLIPLVTAVMLVVMLVGISDVSANPSPEERMPLVFGLFWFVMLAFIFGSLGLYILLGLLGGVFSLMGREFRYPLMGRPLARKLGYSSPGLTEFSDEKEDQVAAGLSHATAIIPMFGLVLPVIVWITQKERSALLRFQALQAAVFQGIGAIAYLGLMVVSFGAGMLAMFAAAAEFSEDAPTTDPAAFAAVFGIILCLDALVLIGGPLYHLFAFIASLRVLRGRDYNYPLLGRFVRHRAEAEPQTPAGGTA